MAPALQQYQSELERNRLGDTLNNKIAARPSKEDLEKGHIL